MEIYGQVYQRTIDIETIYESLINDNVSIYPAGKPAVKAWGQKEFALLDNGKV